MLNWNVINQKKDKTRNVNQFDNLSTREKDTKDVVLRVLERPIKVNDEDKDEVK